MKVVLVTAAEPAVRGELRGFIPPNVLVIEAALDNIADKLRGVVFDAVIASASGEPLVERELAKSPRAAKTKRIFLSEDTESTELAPLRRIVSRRDRTAAVERISHILAGD